MVTQKSQAPGTIGLERSPVPTVEPPHFSGGGAACIPPVDAFGWQTDKTTVCGDRVFTIALSAHGAAGAVMTGAIQYLLAERCVGRCDRRAIVRTPVLVLDPVRRRGKGRRIRKGSRDWRGFGFWTQ